MASSSPVGKATLDESRAARESMEGSLFWNPKAGQGKFEDNFVRILPPHVNMGGKFYQPVAVHFRIGAQRAVFVCPRRILGGRCPVCEEGFRLYRAGQEDPAKDYWPSLQGYMNVVVLSRDGTPAEERPRVWSARREVIDQLIAHMEESGDFTDLEEGRDVRVRRKDVKQGPFTKSEYMITLAQNSRSFDDMEIVGHLTDLTEMARPPAYQEIHALLTQAPAEQADPLAPIEGQARELPAGEPEAPAAEQSQPAKAADPWGDDPAEEAQAAEPAAEEKPKRGRAAKKEDPEAQRGRLKQMLNEGS